MTDNKMGRPRKPDSERVTTLNLSLPKTLRIQIEAVSTRTGKGLSEVVVEILSRSKTLKGYCGNV